MFKMRQILPRFPFKSISGIFMAAALAFTSLRLPEDHGPTNKAYRDVLGRPTICSNHTQNVTMKDLATNTQCQKFLEHDLFNALNNVVMVTPTIVENSSAFKAAGEFTMTTGVDAYTTSPMAIYFKAREWDKGCKAFDGYMTHGLFKYNQLQHVCVKTFDGRWLCHIKELEDVRKEEVKICLGQN